MPDGQLKSHFVRVYVSKNISNEQAPRLQLLRSHAATQKSKTEDALEKPAVVAPGQTWMESTGGQQVQRSGTLLLFDLSNLEFGYRAMVRVRPVVSWKESETPRIAVGMKEVNVGNIVMAVLWTAVVAGAALLVILILAALGQGRPIWFLTGSDGHLSLAMTQVACWTIAIGCVVLGYGLVRLEVPDIPTSLLVLMGASLVTGGIGFFKDAQKLQAAAAAAGAAPARRAWAFGDLVRVFPAGELSLAKAQMIFWTFLLLTLFIAKSILDGAIWDVPWSLVALMGFSQAGYLAPKMAPTP